MTLVPLPSKSPELNPVENIWQYMRDNWLSNRIFANYNDILDHCCFNWNKLVERPWLIRKRTRWETAEKPPCPPREPEMKSARAGKTRPPQQGSCRGLGRE